MHKRFYSDVVKSDEWKTIRDEVDKRITGEDMLMVAALIKARVSFVSVFAQFKPRAFSLNLQMQAI